MDYEPDSPYSGLIGGASFVHKLHTLVSNEDQDIICWNRDGTIFEVKDPKRLESEVLVKYFRHSRFQSLVRQLNFYDFKKISKERSSWIYSHDCFQRNKPEYLDYLRRKTNNSPHLIPHKRSLFLDEHNLSLGVDGGISKRSRLESATSEETESSYSSEDRDSSDISDIARPENGRALAMQPFTHLYSHKWENALKVVCASNVEIRRIETAATVNLLATRKAYSEAEVKNILRALEQKTELYRQKELLEFCLYRNPFVSSHSLLHEVNNLLADNFTIVDGLNSYLAALYPCSSSMNIFHSNELLLMRTFMTFSLVQLRELSEVLELQYSENVNNESRYVKNSLLTWSNFTKLFM